MIDILSFGEVLMDMVATARNVTLFDAPAFEPKPGGAPANVAVGAARLGKRSAFVGKVGADDFGRGLRALLTSEGVDVSGLLIDPHVLTSLAMVSISDRGDPSFALFQGAHATIRPKDLPHELIRGARIFHCGSVTLAGEPSASATWSALREAKQNGALTSYDINWRPMLWHGRDVSTAAAPLAEVDILKMNEGELALVTGESEAERSLPILQTSARLVVITRGEKGALFRYKDTIGHAEPYQVGPVVDATGAGDSFMAALLSGVCDLLDQGRTLDTLNEDDLRWLTTRACKAGAIATQGRGAIPSLPRIGDL